MSARQELAERLASYIRRNYWTAPFGGDVVKERNSYSVLFSKPRMLDGVVRIWGPKFILIECQGPASHGNWSGVYQSEKDALDFLRLAFAEHRWDAAMEIPTKPKKKTA